MRIIFYAYILGFSLRSLGHFSALANGNITPAVAAIIFMAIYALWQVVTSFKASTRSNGMWTVVASPLFVAVGALLPPGTSNYANEPRHGHGEQQCGSFS
jgi:hypothetical protein